MFSKKSSDDSPSPSPSPSPSTKTNVVPFTKGSVQGTPINDGDNALIYLDRHNINCGAKAINQFQYKRDTGGKFHYDFTCADGGNIGEIVNQTDTLNQTDGGGSHIYLDRHDVKCLGDNSVISRFQLTRPANNEIMYNYTCQKSNRPLTCRDVTTPANDEGNGTMYLDRHNVSCGADEAISQFRFTRPSAGKIAYSYKCCK